MFPRLDRYLEIQNIIRHVLLVHTVSLREWQSLLGHLQSLADQVPLGRLHTRPLHHVLASKVSSFNPPDTIVPFSTEFIPHLEWWLDQSRVMAGVFGITHPHVMISTDSSSLRWGAQAIFIRPSIFPLTAQGSWDPQTSSLHINAKELLAVSEALKSFLPSIQDLNIKVETDNKTVVSLVNKQGMVRSPLLHHLTADLLTWVREQGLTLSASYLPGALNVVADQLSRPHQILPT